MASDRMRRLLEQLRAVPIRPDTSLELQRAAFDQMAQTFPVPDDVNVQAVEADGVPCEWVNANGPADPAGDDARPVLVYLHGGGYVIGSARSHRETVARFSRASGARALFVDYRLAPEHSCPAQVADVVTVYRWLLDQGVAGRDVVLTGESAGGGLTIATLVHLRESGLPRPAAAAVVSPWVDLTLTNRSHVDNLDDPLSTPEVMDTYRRWFNPARTFDDPRVSPVFADLHGLPPVYVTASRTERLRDDAVRLVERLRAAGVESDLDLLPDAVHAWTLFPHLPETTETVARIADFLTARLSPGARPTQEAR
ncbi:alpha/beta hydrolase [Sporichthya brevicatena]|uniref:Alpha/beta hydrolase n=1 Tax=Sporichthya brevicatena TaxID=171442 RepID=A0ABN1GYT0_9ACTN